MGHGGSYDLQTAPDEATVEVEFAQAGSLGIKFRSKTAADPPEIKAITAGGLAARLGEARLRPGLVLAAVQGVSVAGQPFAQALQRLKEASRPLRLTFVDAIAVAAPTAAAAVVVVDATAASAASDNTSDAGGSDAGGSDAGGSDAGGSDAGGSGDAGGGREAGL